MNQFTSTEKIKLLSKLYWDVDVSQDNLHRLLNGEIDSIGFIDKTNLYYRILTTFDWYTIQKLIPHAYLSDLLADEVLNRIHNTELKNRLLYARHVLSG